MRERSMKFTGDPVVRRMRWIVVGVILFDALLTLGGQPGSFWRDPETAIRGDGLSIHAATNHNFEFFLGQGWLAYLAATLAYAAVAYGLVSVLPRRVALFLVFSFIFGHGFGAANWIVVRFHLGIEGGPGIYCVPVGLALAWWAFPATGAIEAAVRRLRWVMVAALFVDFANTLLGQPSSYWQDPATMHEANVVVRVFLGRGWMYLLGYNVAVAAGELLLVAAVPRIAAFVLVFVFTFGNFIGASNWFFYVWRMGAAVPVVYGMILSAIIVALAFPAEAGDETGQAVTR
jgi:hypothetical protein